ncbi:MAG TPA: hypothetical protein DDX06_04460 [Curvibacter sp.]|nr:hypothetical protein [Curvibacter sp.]
MSHLLTAQRAILAKAEVTYGTDPTPTGAANYIEVYEPSMPQYEAAKTERMPVRPTLGPISTVVGNGPYKLDFSCHLQSSGAAGTAPAMSPLLKACGLVETVNVGVDVTYTADETPDDSVTLYDNLDGMLHEGNGCRGNLQLEFAHEAVPMAKYSFTGNRVNPVDVAVPAVTVTPWKDPLHVNKANTLFTLHGASPVLHKLSLDLGNEVVWKDHVNSAQQARIINRKISGSLSIELPLIATKDWFAAARNATLAAMQLVHGTAAGYTVQIDATEVQLLDPKVEDADGIQVITMNLLILSGFAIAFK